MAIFLEIDPEDERELFHIRRNLLGWRYITGMTQQEMADRAGHSASWASEVEQGEGQPYLSSLQDWAAAFDLRLQPQVSFPRVSAMQYSIPVKIQQELSFYQKMAQPFDARDWVRLAVVSELVWNRCLQGVSASELSKRLGLTISSVSGWERRGHDPLISKLFTYARALGGRVKLRLIERHQWKHKG